MNKGIYTIADLVDDNGRFKPWEMPSLEFSLEPVEFLHCTGYCSVYLPNRSRNWIVILSHLTVTGYMEKV